jgi:hypothetical protein
LVRLFFFTVKFTKKTDDNNTESSAAALGNALAEVAVNKLLV